MIYPRQDFIGQGHYGKVKSRSHHDVAHLVLLTNGPTKYQLPTPCGFQDIVWTPFYRSWSLRQCQMSNQGHTMRLHTCTPKQCPYQVSTSYTLRFLRYSPDKLFPAGRPPTQTPWVKIIPQQWGKNDRNQRTQQHILLYYLQELTS